MARLARTVAVSLSHHVTQPGNRREAIFFEDGDQVIYRDLLAEQTRKAGVEVWAYCLMPNHVHLILTPTRADPDFLPPCTGQGCVCAFLCGKAHEDRGTIKLNRKSGGRSRAGGRRSTSALHQFPQCPRAMDGAPLSEPVCFGCHGRVASAGGGFLCQPESRASRLGGVCGGLGVV